MTNVKLNKSLTVVCFYLLLLLGWWGLATTGLFPHYILPTPAMVVQRMGELISDGIFVPSVKATLFRMLIGFGMAGLLGLFVGLSMGTFKTVNLCLRSLLLGMQTLPSAAWVPIALLLFGLHDSGIYFVIIMSSMAAVAISTADGIANIPPLYVQAAQTLGTPNGAMWRRVILPAALPSIVTGLKLGWTMGWHGAVSAELIKSSIGLGFLLHMGRELNDVSQIVGIMLVTILIGLLMDRFFFGKIEHRIRSRWGLIPHG